MYVLGKISYFLVTLRWNSIVNLIIPISIFFLFCEYGLICQGMLQVKFFYVCMESLLPGQNLWTMRTSQPLLDVSFRSALFDRSNR